MQVKKYFSSNVLLLYKMNRSIKCIKGLLTLEFLLPESFSSLLMIF